MNFKHHMYVAYAILCRLTQSYRKILVSLGLIGVKRRTLSILQFFFKVSKIFMKFSFKPHPNALNLWFVYFVTDWIIQVYLVSCCIYLYFYSYYFFFNIKGWWKKEEFPADCATLVGFNHPLHHWQQPG